MITIYKGCYVLVYKGLDSEITDNLAIIWIHPWTICIEDSQSPYIDLVLPMIIKKESLSALFPLIIPESLYYPIDVNPLIFPLGMHRKITIYFTSRQLKDFGLKYFCKDLHVAGFRYASLEIFNRIVLIIDC